MTQTEAAAVPREVEIEGSKSAAVRAVAALTERVEALEGLLHRIASRAGQFKSMDPNPRLRSGAAACSWIEGEALGIPDLTAAAPATEDSER